MRLVQRLEHSARIATILASASLLAACTGDGTGLDRNGRPITGDDDQLTPDFRSIARHVFDASCTTCHSGAAAPLGLRLDGDAAYAMLVNAPSVQAPELARVAPGNPNGSYLLRKLEGTATVGGRMPLNGPALSPETIAVIRQWIADGAAPPPAARGLSASSLQPTLEAAWPLPNARLEAAPLEIVVKANIELDITLLSAGTVQLLRSGNDGDFSNGNEVALDTRVDARTLDPTVIAVTVPGGAWVADHYELRISGGDPLALTDRAAQAIDGDADGRSGGDFVLRFSVEEMK